MGANVKVVTVQVISNDVNQQVHPRAFEYL